MEETKTKLKEFIRKEFLSGQENAIIDDEYPLMKNGIIDSVGIFILINFINQQFEVDVESGDVILQNFASVNAISSLISGKKMVKSES